MALKKVKIEWAPHMNKPSNTTYKNVDSVFPEGENTVIFFSEDKLLLIRNTSFFRMTVENQ